MQSKPVMLTGALFYICALFATVMPYAMGVDLDDSILPDFPGANDDLGEFAEAYENIIKGYRRPEAKFPCDDMQGTDSPPSPFSFLSSHLLNL